MDSVEQCDTFEQDGRIDQVLADESLGEDVIFFAPGDELGNDTVMQVQAVTATGRRTGGLDDHDAGLPAAREDGRGDADALCVVAMGFVES